MSEPQSETQDSTLPAGGDHPAGDATPFDPAAADQQAEQQRRDNEERARETQKAFAAEHERQQRQANEAIIAAAGESSNIGSDGQAHFLKMIPKAGVDDSDGDHNPDDFDYVCGSDGEEWPCEQAQELERQEAQARGEQPAAQQ